MKKITLLISTICAMGVASSHAQENWPVIGQGVNPGFSATPMYKVEYDPGFYDAFQSAGFECVRFTIKTGSDRPVAYKTVIDDALKRGITVALAGYVKKDDGKESLVEFWRDCAEFYKMYPKELVLEIMNEPSQGGHSTDEESGSMS